MKTLEEIKKMLSENKEELRRKYGVRILGVFGSYARNEQNKKSDVDILVEIEEPIGFKFFELWDELEEMLGVKVDLLTLKSIKQKHLLWESVKEDLVYV
ncbi:MAG: nucleotidyltransferase family protein [Thermoplasmata archaeon]|nr:MAG: nucleotidyltransferase family protein [Thermoplasmata archaeon]MCD6573338.1 nucleotidyltransferase family protein [Thermoplasmata archaeon]